MCNNLYYAHFALTIEYTDDEFEVLLLKFDATKNILKVSLGIKIKGLNQCVSDSQTCHGFWSVMTKG